MLQEAHRKEVNNGPNAQDPIKWSILPKPQADRFYLGPLN